MAFEFEPISVPEVPLEVDDIRPDLTHSMSADDVKRVQVFHGKEQVEFGQFFKVNGDSADGRHVWNGDCSRVHWIGKRMDGGTIEINGDCGRHLGSEMKSGTIQVSGNTSDWVGAEMKGGAIRIAGNAGHLIGSAYRGSPKGMRGGSIFVKGATGNEIGHTMRGGLIAVGSAGDLVGFNMLAGTVLVFGESGIRHGAGMKRGTLAFLGDHRPNLLPTFRFACRQQLTIMSLLNNQMMRDPFDFRIPENVDLYHGDFLAGGRGEIMLAA